MASLREWDPSPILIPLSIDLQSEPIPIDILDTLGAGKNFKWEVKSYKKNRYWFPTSMTDKEELVNMISRICVQRGFGVAMTSGGTPRRKKIIPDKKMIISCRRFVLARPSKRISDGTLRSNRPITNEDKCKFSMSLYQYHETKRWYFRKFGDGCKHHSGQYKLQPDQVKARSAVVEKDKMKRAIN